MALLIPVKNYVAGLGFGPTTRAGEPPGYAQLQRFWWNPYDSFHYYARFHPGFDFAAPRGTPILASERSKIVALGYNGSSGLRYNCQIRPGTIFVGGHLNDIATKPGTLRDWRLGDIIPRGAVIGTVGDSGDASGTHLHFGVQCVIPGTSHNCIYGPFLFFPGGANQYDPRIKPVY